MSKRVREILENLLGWRRGAALAEVVSDSELLQRFIATRDEAAFELLLWRHGEMVLGVCRRAVRDAQLAEDAFQAVFLVLARKAGSIHGGNVAGWLFRVARRVAARAMRQRPMAELPSNLTTSPRPSLVEQDELTAILDAEVARLPDRLRRAVILCYLGGRTTEDAARELGCPRGTVLSRLATARKRLAERLTRRGVALPAAGMALSASTTERLVSQTIATIQVPFNRLAPTGSALLAESVVRAMTTTKLKVFGCAALLATGVIFGAGWMATGSAATQPASASANPQSGDDAASAPARLETQQKTPKPTDRTERLEKLREQSARIEREIRELQERHSKLSQMEVDLIDLSALQAELLSTDKKILALEKLQILSERNLVAAKKEAEGMPKTPVDEGSVLQSINSDPAVSQASTALQTAELTLARLKSIAKDDSATVLTAKKEVAKAMTGLHSAREAARPRVERELRANRAEYLAARMASRKQQLESGESEMKDLWDARRQLAGRIAARKQVSEKQQAVNDELNVLRELRLDVLRMVTIAELGLELTPTAGRRPGAETRPESRLNDNSQEKLEAQLKDLRQEIKTLGEEVRKLQRKR